MEHRLFVVADADAKTRLDVYLAEQASFTRSRIKGLIEDGNVTVNGATVKAGYELRLGDCVQLTVPDLTECSARPQALPVDIVYEDDSLLVINKAQGMVTHPSSTTPDGTLVNALMYRVDRLSSINGVIRPGIVHRLDKDTSGLLVVAKTDQAHLSLAKQIAEKQAHRIYRAVVDGNVKTDGGIIDASIGRSRSDRKKMAVIEGGRRAVTHYTVLERFGAYTYMEYVLETGRTHQIRVHSKYMHHPIIGDDTYGGSNAFHLQGQLLHAYKLCFTHPVTGEAMEFTAPLPQYFEGVLTRLRGK